MASGVDLEPGDEGYEQCDDGNQVDDDNCDNDCIMAGCGNGRIDPGEVCDDGNQVDTGACTNQCRVAACGDGIRRTDVEAGKRGMRPVMTATALRPARAEQLHRLPGDGVVRSGRRRV